MTEATTVNLLEEPAQNPLPHHDWGPWVVEMRALLRLAGPIVVTQLAQMGVGTIDVLMLGAYSKDALAASALGLSLYYAMWLFGMGPAVAVSPMIAHILGERRNGIAGVRASVRMALWALILLTPIFAVFIWFVGDILLALGEPERLSREAGVFVRLLGIGLPFTLAFSILRGYATALSHPRAPLIVQIVTVFFNAAIAYALIFGHFGAPRLGLEGAGIATALSSIFSFLAMIAIIYATPELRRYRIFRRFFRPQLEKLREVFRLGLPIGFTMIFEAMFFNAGALMMGYFGTASVAAHQVALNVCALFFMVPLGIATAASVRVGLAAGARDMPRVRRAGTAALALSVTLMTLAGIVMAIFPKEIVGLYIDAHNPDNADVVELATVFLRVGAAFQLFDSIQVTMGISLRGLKDANFPMMLAGGSYWLFGFPVALYLAFHLHLEGFGVWIAFVLALFVVAVSMTARFAWLSGAIGRRGLVSA
ncbi:MAG: MATE family efflux transporter [Parvibaculum sp.]|uniref:MATE family efflux transporter n=1 Tax=Parvibaculum sp. TaxID=2024848 RepID=UPI0028476925|nr:MATE family efflux transporter [Parvibaculum sp.]MDR3498270.1 MATE family efflux transporter [Parvibaculum sp.]